MPTRRWKTVHLLGSKLLDTLPALITSLQTTSDHSQVALDDAAQAIVDLRARLDTTLDSLDRLATTGDKQLALRSADLHALPDAGIGDHDPRTRGAG